MLLAVISLHVVGAAFLFHRFFPRESRWLAFVVPEMVFLLLCNCGEHYVPLTGLHYLLPLTTITSILLVLGAKPTWRVMRLPTLVFLGAFAFTVALRMVRPDMEDNQDGVYDLGLISNFLFGQTLPVESVWLPPVKLLYYYCLEHYGASLLIRFLGVDVGTGFNLSCALLAAYAYFLAAATAWHLGRGRLWIVLLALFLIVCAATGDSAYLYLTVRHLAPENIANPYSLLQGQYDPDFRPNPDVAVNGFLQHLTPVPITESHVLMPAGYGGWVGTFHSAQAGQVVICFAILSLIELLRRKKADWPWICLLISPLLMLTMCAWNVPIVGFLVLMGLVVCWRRHTGPAHPRFVLGVTAILAASLEPMLAYFLNWPLPAPFGWTRPDQHTQAIEFLVQWWPVFLPGVALCFVWRTLAFATRLDLLTAAAGFVWVEICNFTLRSDMTSKTWAVIYAAAWVTIIPEIARRKTWPFRTVLLLITATSALTLAFWISYDGRVAVREEIGHLDGQGQFRLDRRKARILEEISRLQGQIIIPGKVDGEGSPSALLQAFSHTRAYVTWAMISDIIFFPNGISEAGRRFSIVNGLYEGKLKEPLYSLRQANVAAVVIYPDDNIEPAVVEQLKRELAPYYTYEDSYFRTNEQLQQDISTGRPCAGVFIYHPEITKLLGPPTDHANAPQIQTAPAVKAPP